MKIMIVSDSDFNPIELSQNDYSKISYENFLNYLYTDHVPFLSEYQFYFDVEGMTKTLYNSLIKSEYYSRDHIKFFRYSKVPYIKENIIDFDTVNIDTDIVQKTKPNIMISSDINIDTGSILVTGQNRMMNTSFMRSLAIQLNNKPNVNIIYISPTIQDTSENNNLENSIETSAKSTKQFADLMQSYKQIMLSRFFLLSNEQVSSIYDLKENKIETEYLIINDIDLYAVDKNDTESINKIKDALESMVRLCYTAGIVLIFSCQHINDIISQITVYNTLHHINIGPISDEYIENNVFLKNTKFNVPEDIGIYYNIKNEAAENNIPYSLFYLQDIEYL